MARKKGAKKSSTRRKGRKKKPFHIGAYSHPMILMNVAWDGKRRTVLIGKDIDHLHTVSLDVFEFAGLDIDPD